MRAGSDPRPTCEAVFARAGGRCEACGAHAELHATPMLEGFPQPTDTLALCAACRPRVVAELSAIPKMDELHARIRRMIG